MYRKSHPFPLMPILLLLLLWLLRIPALSQITFEQHYGGAEDDIGRGVVQTADGGYLLCGFTQQGGTGNYDGYLIRTDPYGDTLWTTTLGGSGNDATYGIIQTGSDTYSVCGTLFHQEKGHSDIWLIALTGTGDTLWTASNFSATNAIAYAIATSHPGGLIVTGTQEDTSGTGHPFLMETTPDGEILWQKQYPFWASGGGNALVTTSDNGYLICGYADQYSPSWNRNLLLIKTDALGDTLWTRLFGGLAYEMGWSACEHPSGGYVAAGYTTGSGATTGDAYVVKTSVNGTLEWFTHFGQSGLDMLNDIRSTGDGQLIATGFTAEQGSELQEAWLVKLTPLGDTLWSKTFGGFRKSYGYCVKQTSDQGFVLCGSTNAWGTGIYDVYLIKTDPDGGIITHQPSSSISQAPVTLFPNPVKTSGMLTTSWDNASVHIFSMQGICIHSTTIHRGEPYSIPCNEWISGIYLVWVTNGTQSVHLMLIRE